MKIMLAILFHLCSNQDSPVPFSFTFKIRMVTAVTFGLRYAKRSLMSWVVIPKEGWARGAAPALLLVWHRLFRIFFLIFFFFFVFFVENFWFFFFVNWVSQQKTEMVWQWLRTLGTFSRNATHCLIKFPRIFLNPNPCNCCEFDSNTRYSAGQK